jgi:hypothetical protein
MGCCKWMIYTVLACLASAASTVTDARTPTSIIEGDPTLSLLNGSKSDLNTCIGRTNRYMAKLPDHGLTIGVYIDSAGRPVNLAVLNSSDQTDLDQRDARLYSACTL